jgi:hypothetical protein
MPISGILLIFHMDTNTDRDLDGNTDTGTDTDRHGQ